MEKLLRLMVRLADGWMDRWLDGKMVGCIDDRWLEE